MVIDMHTHIFPEKIAAKTLELLAGRIHIEPYTNGMADGLAASAKAAGIDLAVILPVVTKPSQFESINKFALQFREGPLYSFGGIHPASETYKEQIRQMKDMGFTGIKLHPDYQGKGYATENLKAVINEIGQMGFKRLTAGYFIENKASQRVMEKAGMTKTDIKEEIQYRGISHNCEYYEYRY